MSDNPRLHYERFLRNRSLAAQLETDLPQHADWCCVALFYAGLHLLDAYLTTKFVPFKTATHVDRQAALARFPECKRFGHSYRKLQALSELVRYDVEFVYQAEHLADAQRHFAKVVAVVEPWVKELLGIK